MSRPVVLDLDSPMTSLVEASGLTKAELARRRGLDRAAVNALEKNGSSVNLAILLAYAEVAGLVLELRATKKKKTD